MTLTLISKHHVTGNMWSFILEPSEPISWIAGQFIRIELPHDNPDDEGTKRFYTISSAPHERVIQIITRITDSTFKQALSNLLIGGQIKLLDLPSGDFIWEDTPQPLVFVAQGIGITPFYSILKDRAHHQLPLSAKLFYANHTGDVPLRDDLETWKRHHGLELNLSREPFTAKELAILVPELSMSTVYVSGPRSLIELLSPPYGLRANQLKEDFFPNYSAASY